jgi:SAM-dependent methyltransferase
MPGHGRPDAASLRPEYASTAAAAASSTRRGRGPTLAREMNDTRFDRAYYDRFYRGRTTRVTSAAETSRLCRFVTAYLDYLGVAVRSALDVGCGLGLWQSPLKKAYPGLRYTGLERSEHLAEELGWVCGSIVTYPGPRADLVICRGVLQYLADRELPRAIENLARLSRRALYLEVLTHGDWENNVDRSVTDGAVHLRPVARYKKLLARAGFVACGGGVFLPPDSNVVLYELEQG